MTLFIRGLIMIAGAGLIGAPPVAEKPHSDAHQPDTSAAETAASRPRVAHCRDSTAAAGVRMARLRGLARSGDPRDTLVRSTLSLPSANPDDVGYVRDSVACFRALTALRRERLEATLGREVHLIRYGTDRYVAMPPRGAGEVPVWYVFDSTFAMLSASALR